MKRERLEGIDLLRGVVMVLMALDHARDYFGDFSNDPTNLETTTPALFLTRWVTHFCAPVFVFLAGTSAYLYGARRSRRELAGFLATRGLWLILLEFTAMNWAWTHAFPPLMWFVQVIAAIGFAMVVLAGLVFLGTRGVLAAGLLVACGHNLLDPVVPEDLGRWSDLWVLLHEAGFISVGGVWYRLLAVYPLLPWVGVIALGYAFGAWMRLERAERRRRTLLLGAGLCVLFVALRALNGYGNALPWSAQETAVGTLMSFLNCQKYPPSLAYLAMTLGPALVFLGLVDREAGPLGRVFVRFGRVPLFYYWMHMMLVHTGSRVYHRVVHGEDFRALEDGLEMLFDPERGALPEWYGVPLPGVYLSWFLVVVALYPLCVWYGGVKRRGRSRLWSYL